MFMQRQPIVASEPRTVPVQVSVYTAPANPDKDLSLKLRLPPPTLAGEKL